MGLGIRGWRRVGLGLCKVGGVGPRSNSAPWILCSAVRTISHDDARPHVARLCTQFLEAENIPVLAWPAYSPDMSPIEHVWDALDRRIRRHVPVTANIQQLRTAIEEEWTNIPQATINNLINSMRRRWQMVVTPDTDWFSFIFLFSVYIQCSPLILAPLVNMSKGSCENKSALFILFIFHSKNSQISNLSLK